jgi:hypothetical protein
MNVRRWNTGNTVLENFVTTLVLTRVSVNILAEATTCTGFV